MFFFVYFCAIIESKTMKLHHTLCGFFSLFTCVYTFAQSHAEHRERWLQEIYIDCPNALSEELNTINSKILDRYQWLHDPSFETQLITHNLSEFSLQDKCNVALEADYSKSHFDAPINPLKYFLPFYSNETLIIQVGSSDYYMILHPF